ncbi:MAG: lytic transglycosylase domain-containing protein [Candidatus Rokubacteria bacterium]|nr:lytic transglycosylase domain-containing protein [Candidatus Rokubacteria bacterium]
MIASVIALTAVDTVSADVLREAEATLDLARAILGPLDASRATPSTPILAPRDRRRPPVAWRLRPSAPDIDHLIHVRARAVGLNPALVQAVVRVESAYNPVARSPKGALGLGQLMPGTAALLGVADPLDPAQNLDGTVRFLAMLLWEFGDVRTALVAYNAGPEVVRQKRPIPSETVAYVRDVLREFARLTHRAPAR